MLCRKSCRLYNPRARSLIELSAPSAFCELQSENFGITLIARVETLSQLEYPGEPIGKNSSQQIVEQRIPSLRNDIVRRAGADNSKLNLSLQTLAV